MTKFFVKLSEENKEIAIVRRNGSFSDRNQGTTNMKYYIEEQAWKAILSFFKKKKLYTTRI
ncbi:MAG: hypothetical protein LF885_06275 [Rickettsia endosymbiont of Culicoides impunctatus]|uniref:hypothetical protein n=1 Tax=unclassified Candidatus Tisiphia TaxID=2996318 RepID=UPI001E811093|nr:hypothetical protein [Rickettsia endosymbiont of Platyusa sonomae]UCM85561.1 MAG: hypothetical protein LF885_06275 [Rickettsia endosymbiont of Culicoides impunctatus]